MKHRPTTFPNGGILPLAAVPRLAISDFTGAIASCVREGARIAALFGHPASGRAVSLHAVLAWEEAGLLSAVSSEAEDVYPALTPRCSQAHWFEREIAEQWGLKPEGHPWLKPIRFQPSGFPGRDAWGRKPGEPILPGVTDYFQVAGVEVHEVAVGPVHAGVIEPGHFRFQCAGETVLHLEISLGYQHRGVERALAGGPGKRTHHYIETLAGDTTIGHATAYSQTMEALTGCSVPPRAQVIRGIALELERVANHIGDLGALAGDVGFLPTLAYCGRIRGDVLNMTAALCGNRFGRGLVHPGGVGGDIADTTAAGLLERLEQTSRDVESAVQLLWSTPSVLARFEETGRLSREVAREIGLVGVAARACGLERDVRRDFPGGIFRFTHIPISSWTTGDVFARAYVRWLEVQRSLLFIKEQLASLPRSPILGEVGTPAPEHLAASLVEGWRGEIAHIALTDESGRLARYKVVDPSFHNWFGLALALRGQQISDFPLCNKSFNLSYCGHDL